MQMVVVVVVVVVGGGRSRASVGRFSNAHGQHFAGQGSRHGPRGSDTGKLEARKHQQVSEW